MAVVVLLIGGTGVAVMGVCRYWRKRHGALVQKRWRAGSVHAGPTERTLDWWVVVLSSHVGERHHLRLKIRATF